MTTAPCRKPTETSIATSQDAYADRAAAEVEVYRNCDKVHDLPAIFHYWSNKFLKPKLESVGVSGINAFYEDGIIEGARRTRADPVRVLSVGAGNCDVEVDIAVALKARGMHHFSIECLELNGAMLARGRATARLRGVSEHLQFTETDFNRWQPVQRYAAVVANQSLHHVLELEHLYDAIASALLPEGLFMTSDMIGRNGHMRWPEALALVGEFWGQMPERYRYNMMLQRHEDPFQNWDCSGESFEGIRAQDVLPLLLPRFHFHLFAPFSNIVDVFIDRPFGHHFDAGGEWDQLFIDRVQARDDAAILRGEITPTHMLAMMGLQPSASPVLLDGLTPERCIRRPDPA